MNPKGRQQEEKLWESKLRHNFLTNYLQDPDLHTLLFISEAETNNIIREALRDWMVKTGSKALDPEFQAKVFLTASMAVARGVRPVGSDVLSAMGEPVRAKTALNRKEGKPGRVPTAAPSPAQVRPTAVAKPAPAASLAAPVAAQSPPSPAEPHHPLAHDQDDAAEAPDQAVQRAPATPAAQPAAKKAPITLDFGSEPEMADEQADTAPAKASQRSRWLARHKS